MQPLASIFLPSYNHVNYIDEAIRSAVEQDYENLEVVVGDDGSTDGSADRIADWSRRFPERVLPVVGEHLGITGNCNRLLRACRGKYIVFHSGDDILLPGRVKAQVEWLEQDDCRVLCGHDVEAFDSETGEHLYFTSDSRVFSKGRGARRAIEQFGVMPDLSLAIRASALPTYGYDERAGIASSFKLQVDVLASGGEYGYVPGVYARYRVHSNSITQRSITDFATHQTFLQDLLTVLTVTEGRYPDLGAGCRRARARLLFSEGRWRQNRVDMSMARAYFRAAAGNNARLLPKVAVAVSMTFLPAMLNRLFESCWQRLRGRTVTR